MHELLLFGQVPQARHDQLLRILAGVTGMQPRRVVERHLIFKPIRSPGQNWAQVGGSQGVQNTQAQALQGQLHNELYYLQLVGDITDSAARAQMSPRAPVSTGQDSDQSDINGDGENRPKEGRDGETSSDTHRNWTLHFQDLPEVAGRRPVTSRMMSNVELIEGDPFAFMESLGYTYVSGDSTSDTNLTLHAGTVQSM